MEREHVCVTKLLDVVCVSEHWLTADQFNLYVPENFTVADIMYRSQLKMVDLEYLSETQLI